MSDSNSIINSLKRLERAGSESGRATAKLREAACEVGDKIEDIVTRAGLTGVRLPRGYRVDVYPAADCGRCGTVDYVSCLVTLSLTGPDAGPPAVNSRGLVEVGGCPDCGHKAGWERTDGHVALAFARDIADGLVDEIAAMIEARTTDSHAASADLAVAA